MNLSDIIVVMEKGKVAQVGTPEEIYRRPVSAYVADFVGETNLLPGRVVGAGSDGLRVTTKIGELSVPGATGTAGGAITVALRPEAIVIGPSLVGGLARGRGIVQSRSFLGALTRVVIAINGTTLMVDRPGMLSVETGDAIEFGWRDEDALALPADKSLPEEIQ